MSLPYTTPCRYSPKSRTAGPTIAAALCARYSDRGTDSLAIIALPNTILVQNGPSNIGPSNHQGIYPITADYASNVILSREVHVQLAILNDNRPLAAANEAYIAVGSPAHNRRYVAHSRLKLFLRTAYDSNIIVTVNKPVYAAGAKRYATCLHVADAECETNIITAMDLYIRSDVIE